MLMSSLISQIGVADLFYMAFSNKQAYARKKKKERKGIEQIIV